MYVQKRRIVWDLCSGLGGFTEAFAQSEWEVYRFELNESLQDVPFTQILDVKDWLDWVDDYPTPELIVASPPCTEFSSANWRVNRDELEPDMSIVKACLDIIDYIKPTWWILENVKGAVRFFKPVIGLHRQAVGNKQYPQFYLWGNFPYLSMKPGWTHTKIEHRDPQKRALIPFEISLQVKRAVEQQTMLRSWS